jgi:hypothetical protein
VRLCAAVFVFAHHGCCVTKQQVPGTAVSMRLCPLLQPSCIISNTVGSQQRAEAAKQKRLEAESAREELEWDASTCISRVSRGRTLGATDPGRNLYANPD